MSLKQILNATFLVPFSFAGSPWEAAVIGNSELSSGQNYREEERVAQVETAESARQDSDGNRLTILLAESRQPCIYQSLPTEKPREWSV